MASLFSASTPRPLADSIRPSEFQDIFGQEHLFDSYFSEIELSVKSL